MNPVMQRTAMRSLILSISLPLVLLAACSKSDPPVERPASAPTEETPRPDLPDAQPVRAEGVLPAGFPYEIMEGDRIGASTSFAVDGVQHYEAGLESTLAADAVADYWASELEAKGVKVVRQRVEEAGRVRIVIQGEDDAGVYSRVSVLRRTSEGETDEPAPADADEARTTKVKVYVGKR